MRFFLHTTLFALVMTSALPALSQGGYADVLLRMGAGSRSEAMGRAFTAVPGNPESGFYNPALTTSMSKREIDISLRALSLDRTFSYAGFSTYIRPKSKRGGKDPLGGGLALSWMRAAVSNIDGRDFSGARYASYSHSQNLFNFSFALNMSKRVAIGATARLFWNRFPELGEGGQVTSSRAMGLDIGGLYKPMEGVWIGAALKNMNAGFSWTTDKIYERGTNTVDAFPRRWRIGVATSRLYKNLLVAADLEGSEQQGVKLFLGLEAKVKQQAVLRLGMREQSPTFGAGYSFSIGARKVTLHYAFSTRPHEVSSDHIFSWAFRF